LIVIPAIDIKGGRCVRLKQGRMSEETIFSDSPEDMALRWYEEGAERLHVVDLDGAVGGRPVNADVIRRIVGAVPVPVQLGGGIRDAVTLRAYFEMGLQFLILGTVALKAPNFVREACSQFPGRIIVGVDANKDGVAVEGWTEGTKLSPGDLAKSFEKSGVSAIIYTDIQRDGMRTGPNLEATRDVARSTEIPVIASGGISGIEDVREILTLEREGVMGMITGRALYEGGLDLDEAIKLVKGQDK